MKHLTRTTLAVAAAFCAVSQPAQAHFQLLYTPKVMLEKHGKIPLKLVFSHPMENGHTMDMGKPEQFFVMLKDDKKEDLLSTLEEVSWQGSKNKGKAYSTTYPVKLNGDYVFALVPAPYFEESEGAFIQQITKTYVNKGGMPTHWNKPLGLPTEIVPMNKPYMNFAGTTFTGQLLSEGKPAAGIECEIEYINTDVNVQTNSFGKGTKGTVPDSAWVVVTDSNGMFTFGIPKPGVWGFACLGSGPAKKFQDKELSQDAVLWINATQMK